MKKCYRVSIIIILISIFIVSGFKLFNFYLEYSTTNKRNANLHKLYKESISQSSINPTLEEKQQFENLIEMNPDYVGWLEIPNTSISFPVVQLDNEFYLSHNFLKEKDACRFSWRKSFERCYFICK